MSGVLVAFATKYGSTQEAANAVAARLNALGIEAEARPAAEVRDAGTYSAVVLGTALYFFRWRGEAHRFLRRNRKTLAGVPVAVFGLGPIEDTPEQFAGAREHLDKGLAKHPWLTPRASTVFGGRFDPTRLRFPDNNPAMRSMPARDLLDLRAVTAWAESLPDALGVRAS
jgi:menaquinone-dependent protoporphyrinogen oxidase